jgi:hypothetical protein
MKFQAIKTYICSVKFLIIHLLLLGFVRFTELKAQELPSTPVGNPQDSLLHTASEKIVRSGDHLCDKEISRQILSRLDTLFYVNTKANFVHGYRILVYSGTSREEAEKAKQNAYIIFPKGNVYMTYNFPTFKVRYGNFYSKFTAWLSFIRIRSVFPSANISEEIVYVNP